MTTHDAVIIGAGHNGLACAAHLAEHGWSVGVYEGAERPGGAVKTLELTEPGFHHDWGPMVLSFFAASAFNRRHGRELAAHGLAFATANDCFASVFPDGRWIGISKDLAETKERFAAFSPRDARAWAELVEGSPGRAEMLAMMLDSPTTPLALALASCSRACVATASPAASSFCVFSCPRPANGSTRSLSLSRSGAARVVEHVLRPCAGDPWRRRLPLHRERARPE